MNTKIVLIVLAAILIIGLAIILVIGGVSAYLLKVELAARPSVEFKEPLNGQTLRQGDMLVRFIARDKGGIEHVELWADGTLVASERSSLPGGSSPFPMVETWKPETSGPHTLTARAYGQSQRSSEVFVVVQISDQAGQMNEVLSSDQASGMSPLNPGQLEGYSDLGPGALESLDAGDVVVIPAATEEEEGLVDIPAFIDKTLGTAPLYPRGGEPSTPLLDALAGILARPPLDIGQILQVEALTLETDRAYDGAFCYVSLAGSPVERVPSDGFVRSLGTNAWDIKAQMDGENKRTVILGKGEDQLLSVWVNCWGAIFDAGGVYELGSVNMIHPHSDWSGTPIERRADGPSGWFKVSYRIVEPGGTGGAPGASLPAPVMYHTCYELDTFDYCELLWYYPEDARGSIDGYLLEQNHNATDVVANVDKRKITLTEFTGSHGLPACGQTDTYQVRAYKGDPYGDTRSPWSNSISISSEPCYHYAKVSFDYLETGCLTGDASLNTCGRAGNVPGDIEGGLTGSANLSYDKDMGCSYADLWANEKKIDVGKSDWWYCYWWATGGLYKISDIWEVATDSVLVSLNRDDGLTVGMMVKDWDLLTHDDTQCYGEYVHTFGELQDIAALPEQKRTYSRNFSERGGGSCAMQYTIQIMPPDFLSGPMLGGAAAP